jgi:mRNA-degrading endonuclease YafQ of YafQ-DinJ toxin-antitoxin module
MGSKASGSKRRSGYTKQFGKDWRRLERSGRYPMEFVRTGTHAELLE